MGGSSWLYFAEGADDPETALHDLKAMVFESGAYLDPTSVPEVTLPRIKEIAPAEAIQMYEDRLKEWKNSPPLDIGELMERSESSGTHSILDMSGISETACDFSVSRLPDQMVQSLIKTSTPSRQEVESSYDELLELCERWRGLYLTYFAGGKPAGLAFVGISGD